MAKVKKLWMWIIGISLIFILGIGATVISLANSMFQAIGGESGTQVLGIILVFIIFYTLVKRFR